jgi:hypothetical protein
MREIGGLLMAVGQAELGEDHWAWDGRHGGPLACWLLLHDSRFIPQMVYLSLVFFLFI